MNPDLYLVAALAALLPAPALDVLSATRRWMLPALNGFVIAFVAILVFFEMLPHALHHAGPWALAVAIMGFALPQLGEVLWRSQHQRRRSLAALVVLALAAHAAMDGAVLAGAARQGSSGLPLAILVHRLPVGLVVWWMAGGSRRPVLASLCLAALGAATVSGYAGGLALASWTNGAFGAVEAFVAGALLHVLGDTHMARRPAQMPPSNPGPCPPPAKDLAAPFKPATAETAGVGVAVVAAALVPFELHVHPGAGVESSTAHALLQLLLISAPALVLGLLVAGLIGTAVPRAGLRWASRGGPWGQSIRGTLLGLPIPICSCGVVPVYAGLHRAGMPASAGLAFLVATPELGVESFLLSYPLLGAEMTVTRLVAAAALALGVGVVVGRTMPASTTINGDAEPEPTSSTTLSWPERGRQVVQVGFSELLESTGPWLLFGLAVAALLEPNMLSGLTSVAPGPWSVVLFALIGIPLYVCASGATPLAAGFVAAGISPGAALAFLLAGPATNLTTFGLLHRLHGRRVAVLFAATAIIGAVSLGLITDGLWSSQWRVPGLGSVAATVGPIHWLSLAILAVASFRLVLLRGPVSLVQSLFGSGHGSGRSASSPKPCPDPCCSPAPSRP